MKEYIKYYYNMDIEEYSGSAGRYVLKNKYRIFLFKTPRQNKEELKKINDILMKYRLNHYNIVLSKDGNVVVEYLNNKYVLMEVSNCDTNVRLDEYEIPVGEKKVEISELWKKKIEYFTDLFNKKRVDFKEFAGLYNYYLGMSESALTIAEKYLEENIIPVGIQHVRVDAELKGMGYYDICNMIIDNRSRDVAEYIKSIYFEKEREINLDDIRKYVVEKGYSEIEKTMLVCRMIYPSYFFDIVENGGEGIDRVVNNREKYENLLGDIINIFAGETGRLRNFWIKKVEL